MHKIVKIGEEGLKKIEAAVAGAEKKTSGEIVPMIVSSSHDYWWIHLFWALLGVVVCSLWALWRDHLHWGLDVPHLLLYQTLAALAGLALPFFDPIKRLFIPKKWAAFQVHRQCFANYMSQGLQETRDRTGVLIYISLLERQVEILADKGINEKTPKGYWMEQVNLIIKGIHGGKTAEALEEVVHHIGDKLAENFPPRHDDTNELSNKVRLGHHSPDPKEK